MTSTLATTTGVSRLGGVGEAFLAAFNDHDTDSLVAQLSADASVHVEAAGLSAASPDDLREFVAGVFTAFPDAGFRVRRSLALSDGSSFVEGTLEGNQSAPFMGAPNQGVHLVIPQAWRFEVSDGCIVSVAGYWCQNILLRRLGVRRIDELSR